MKKVPPEPTPEPSNPGRGFDQADATAPGAPPSPEDLERARELRAASLKRIPMRKTLERSVGAVLEASGFVRMKAGKGSTNTLTYERAGKKGGPPDKVVLFGSTHWPNALYCEASCEGMERPINVKRLATDCADYEFTPTPLLGERWEFERLEELEAAVRELAELVREKLLPWFESPVDPTAASREEDFVARQLGRAKKMEELAPIYRARGYPLHAQSLEVMAQGVRKNIDSWLVRLTGPPTDEAFVVQEERAAAEQDALARQCRDRGDLIRAQMLEGVARSIRASIPGLLELRRRYVSP